MGHRGPLDMDLWGKTSQGQFDIDQFDKKGEDRANRLGKSCQRRNFDLVKWGKMGHRGQFNIQ